MGRAHSAHAPTATPAQRGSVGAAAGDDFDSAALTPAAQVLHKRVQVTKAPQSQTSFVTRLIGALGSKAPRQPRQTSSGRPTAKPPSIKPPLCPPTKGLQGTNSRHRTQPAPLVGVNALLQESYPCRRYRMLQKATLATPTATLSAAHTSAANCNFTGGDLLEIEIYAQFAQYKEAVLCLTPAEARAQPLAPGPELEGDRKF